ncbi:hypothetical protein EJ04DRAFT_509428, partial [Polyplosphaeria fusca]
MYNAARPTKRGDKFARTHHLDSDGPASKRPRFDPRNPSTLAADVEDEDPILDADEIGKRGGVKRNAVNIDGYESDSSIENFDEAEAKASKDDDDIFADSDGVSDEDKAYKHTSKKKNDVRFLENHQIKGQVATSKGGGHVGLNYEDESSSDSGNDEERDRLDSDVDEEVGAGGKKRHAPKLDAFNMKQEQEEGRFDEAGNYVRTAADPDAAQDSWLDGITKKQILRAAEAKDMAEEKQRVRRREEDSITTGDSLTELIPHLARGESCFDALARHNKVVQQNTPKFINNKKRRLQEMNVEEDPAKATALAKAKEAIQAITNSAARLQKRGYDEIYEEPRELITRHYRRETGEIWKDPPRTFEFRWEAAPDEVHGPYDGPTMHAWYDEGHFEAGAEFRTIGGIQWFDEPDF